jgi:hypothetical protein
MSPCLPFPFSIPANQFIAVHCKSGNENFLKGLWQEIGIELVLVFLVKAN